MFRTLLLCLLFLAVPLLAACPADDDDVSDDDDAVDDDDVVDDDDSGDDDDTGTDDDDATADADGDGFDASEDCDDSDGTVYPGAEELCDGLDNDCDGALGGDELDDDADGVTECDGDCDDADLNNHPGNIELCDGADNDCDTVVPLDEIDDDLDGQAECEGDCDDADAGNFDGNPEVCDGQDNDCDLALGGDEIDDDLDGQTECGGDCDDADAANFDGNPEVCDGQDNDCDLAVPGDEVDDDADGQAECEGDCDDADPLRFDGNAEACDDIDNDCDNIVPITETDDDGDGQAECQGDCDDADPLRFDGNTEACDNIDNDCDNIVPLTETDDDGDGVAECEGDCDDADASNFPGNVELCDGQDNDCDAATNEQVDGDGDSVSLCGGDCDDDDGDNFPGNVELCDGQDNDCDPATDFVDLAFSTGDEEETGSTSGYFMGNSYRVDAGVTLVGVEQRLNAVAGTELTWMIFGSTEPVSDFTLIAQTTTTVGAADAGTLTWHASGPLSLTSPGGGGYYAIGVYFPTAVEYGRFASPVEVIPTSFGTMVGGVVAAGSGGPPGGAEIAEASFGWVAQQIWLEGEADLDSDGFLGCDDDCNDGEASAWPGNPEVDCDLVDNDCDAATPDCDGGLIVSEIFNDAVGSDSDMEWFELYNASAVDIDLAGWLIRDDGTDDWYLGSSSLVIPAGGYLLLGESDDPTSNGGLYPPAVFLWNISVANTTDELVLISPLGELVDEVIWADGFPANEGASMSLDPLALDSVLNDLVASWCVSFSAPYGPGQDQGTPGFPNPSCAIPASGAAAGDLVINEVMQNPNSSDADREWFELFNPTGSDIDLMGWQISDFGNNLHVVDSSVIVPAGGWAVLGEVLDTASNGGVTVDYACFNDLGLDNSSDELVITSPEGVWVDWISWDNGVTFPDPSGVSMNLDPVFANGSDNDVGANWCESTAASYGDGGAGTPGAVNTSCP
jgi:hypothetical protein